MLLVLVLLLPAALILIIVRVILLLLVTPKLVPVIVIVAATLPVILVTDRAVIVGGLTIVKIKAAFVPEEAATVIVKEYEPAGTVAGTTQLAVLAVSQELLLQL